jgi:hypothetical protein
MSVSIDRRETGGGAGGSAPGGPCGIDRRRLAPEHRR